MSQPQPEDLPLPELRPELELLAAAPDRDGRPTWLIHDALLNRFTQIDAAAFEALRRWRECRTIGELIERTNAEGRTHLDVRNVASLIDFFYSHQLTIMPRNGKWQSFVSGKEANRHSLAARLVHNYLFFRIPLVRPQKFLERTLPLAGILCSRASIVLILLMGTIGLYLASRQWEGFTGALLSYFSWEGAASGALALGFIKVAHELGHAYTAVAFGCRVHTMGLAFVVMAPMPYTDVTDSWRLTSRRKRLLIDGAGMMTEAAIAAVALFVWAFLQDGPLRSAAFVLSAVSIVSSVAINLNPFMRFDGYYLLCEMLGVENLQSRAFALGRWKVRELLFGLNEPCPEDMPGNRVRLLILYAWAVWIYRVTLFIGIAILVYHYFFKVLGIILFAVEIVYFVARPIAREILVWWKMRSTIFAARRTRWTLAAAAASVLGCVIPWSTTVELPAVLELAELQMIYPTRNARVATVHVKHGESVRMGDPIVTLECSEIDDEIARAQISLQIAQVQYGRRLADAVDREGSLVLESTMEALQARIDGLRKEQRELRIVAPFDGKIVNLNPELHSGRWLAPREQIAIVVGGNAVVAKGYVLEADVGRLEAGTTASFIPEHPSRHRVSLQVTGIATAGAAQIEIPDLASINGGRIVVNPDERRRLVPASAQYLVTLSALEPAAETDLSVRGVVLAHGRPESLLVRTWRRALGVVLRESGA